MAYVLWFGGNSYKNFGWHIAPKAQSPSPPESSEVYTAALAELDRREAAYCWDASLRAHAKLN